MKRTHSYSSIALYRKCPAQFEWNYVLGNKTPPGPAADRGTELHLLLEDFFKGKTPYPSKNPVLKPWQRYMEALTIYTPTAETEYCVHRDWTKADYEDPNAWVRGKADLACNQGVVRHLYDWKSGRVYPDHEAQGDMYMAMEQGDYERYCTVFVYLDIPLHTVPRYRTLEDRDRERKKIDLIVQTINEDTEYKPTPSHNSCHYCKRSWRAGGPCHKAP